MEYKSICYTYQELEELERVGEAYFNQDEIDDIDEFYNLHAPKELLDKMEYRRVYKAKKKSKV